MDSENSDRLTVARAAVEKNRCMSDEFSIPRRSAALDTGARDHPAGGVRVEAVRSPRELETRAAPWEALRADALEQNINYEPVPLLALLEAFSPADVTVLFIWHEETLIGVWPVQRKRTLPLLPVRQIASFHTEHMMASVPLVHRDHVRRCIDAFTGWLDGQRMPTIFTITEAVDRSAFWPRLIAALNGDGHVVETVSRTDRAALLRDDLSAEEYRRAVTSARSRNALARKRRRLESEHGPWRLHFAANALTPASDALASVADPGELLAELIAVEASSWKGEHGSAIARQAGLERFVRTLAEHAAARGRLFLIVARAGERVAAAQIGVVNDGEILIYKLGFDESLGRHSPGLLLMHDVVHQALEASPPCSIDGCGASGSRLFNTCLGERRELLKLRVASGHPSARLLLSGLAWLRRRRRRHA
mgnify:CR=1 FL=1